MKKFLIAILALLTIFCLVACNNNTSLIACPKCGYENSNGAKFCSGCGIEMFPLNDNEQGENNNDDDDCLHSWGDWQEIVVATCTNTGTKERSCSKCSLKETGTIEALGHTTTTCLCR